jgi:hypothetical protein
MSKVLTARGMHPANIRISRTGWILPGRHALVDEFAAECDFCAGAGC